MAKKGARNNESYNRPNLWGMLQNIFIAAISKGQLLLLGAISIMIILVLKMSPENANEFAHEVLEEFRNYHLVGWVGFLLFAWLWFYTSKRARVIHSKEMDRVSKEKSELQKILHGKLPSTRDKK